MKRILQALSLLLAFSGLASAQDASLSSPVAQPSEAKLVLQRFDCNFATNQCVISLNVMDSGKTTVIRYFNLTVPDSTHPTATFPGILAAAGTTRATETGGAERRANFRIIGYLFDQGYLPQVSSVAP